MVPVTRRRVTDRLMLAALTGGQSQSRHGATVRLGALTMLLHENNMDKNANVLNLHVSVVHRSNREIVGSELTVSTCCLRGVSSVAFLLCVRFDHDASQDCGKKTSSVL